MNSSGRPGPGSLRRLRLRDVLLWTLPPFVGALYLLGASVNDYRRLAQFDDWWSNLARVDHMAWWRVRSALQLPRAIALDQGLSAEDTRRSLVDLRVDRAAFDAIASDPVGRPGESVEAYLHEGNSRQKVDLKLRGDTSVHWSGEKKTISIRSDRGEMFHRSRVNAFSTKEVLAQFTSNSMAADFGLLAPPTAVVPLFLNQRFYGMFRTFAPPDETFLRNAGRIPGNIFRGDTAERGDSFKRLPRELFINPYIWDRAAANDRPGAIGTAKLFDFVARVNRAGKHELPESGAQTATFLERLNTNAREGVDSVSKLFEILDRDEIARLLALDLCVGDPWHSSGVHNHFWYEDSSSGLLHPIPWDLRMLDLSRPPPGANFNRFWRAALRDPRVFAAALQEIGERTRDGKLLATVTRRVEESWNLYRDGFEFDRMRSGSISDVGTPQQVLGTLRGNLATLDEWCADARASVCVTSEDGAESIIDIVVDGRAPIRLVGLKGLARGEAALWADADLDGQRSARDREIPLSGLEPARAASALLLAERELVLPGVRVGERLDREAIHYRYFLRGIELAPQLEALELRNAITDAPVVPAALTRGVALPAPASLHPWSLREPPVEDKRLAGEVRLRSTLEVERNTTLYIAAGTRLVLDPDVSIHCKGRIVAQGSAQSPIEFSSSDPRHPWGSLALWGEGANASVFQHVRFSGGGGALLDGVEYTGMVCVHGARAVRFEDCEFSGNQRCDDALHADVADVTVTRSWFHDTNADALDFDISTGRIEHCKVERAGNDGFDLMTCSPDIVGNEIVDNGDKGISVGENSSPFIFANTIRGCQRGIEVKDRSSPLIVNNTIVENRVGVLARLKNWRYERGGWPRLVRTTVAANELDLDLEPNTRWTELESRIGASDDGAGPQFDANSTWLYASQGVLCDGPSMGATASWRGISRAPILDEERYPDAWRSPRASWQVSGGVTSLRVSEDCLVARMDARPGELSREVAWDLREKTRTHWLVLEASASDIESAQVRVGRSGEGADQGPLRARLEFGAGPDRFAYTVLLLPAASYSSLALELDPKRRIVLEPQRRLVTEGQLRLHRWFIVSAISAELGTTK